MKFKKIIEYILISSFTIIILIIFYFCFIGIKKTLNPVIPVKNITYKSIIIEHNVILVEDVIVTAYPPLKECTDDSPYITAWGTKVKRGIVAISKPLEIDYDLTYGDEIIIPSIGRFIIADRMNQTKWEDYRVDIFMWNLKDCLEFGKQIHPIILVKKKKHK